MRRLWLSSGLRAYERRLENKRKRLASELFNGAYDKADDATEFAYEYGNSKQDIAGGFRRFSNT